MNTFGYCCGPSSVAAHAAPVAPPSGPIGLAVAEGERKGAKATAATVTAAVRSAYLIESTLLGERMLSN
ncbi:hypothetical protein NBRGN_113_00450 [Nocardia brasiliensis NBRC 14402]|nr:hypothetical protein NBRGN_113_00450 [Nocardia brasiliensis NBRC 14402]